MIKLIDDQLYATICEWWQAHNWPTIPRPLLPQRGYVSLIDDTPVIAGFLYKDETAAFGMIEWIVANPDISGEMRLLGFEELISHITDVARQCGIIAVFTTSDKESLCNRLINNGFNVTDKSVTHLMKEI